MSVRRETVAGRLILLHGPAGTGKTTVLRALAHEWRSWCQVDCVLDPEALFADPAYMMEVAIGFDDEGDGDGDAADIAEESAADPATVEAAGGQGTTGDVRARGETDDAGAGDGDADAGAAKISDSPVGGSGSRTEDRMGQPVRRRWRLLVIEDCDELIRGDGRGTTGQQLSRLLNLTDGLVGQGREVLVALTTNEDLLRLHPAVVRPGRCLAQIEVGALPYAEAVSWLGTAEGVGSTMTLAELFALRDGRGLPRPARVDARHGLYL